MAKGIIVVDMPEKCFGCPKLTWRADAGGFPEVVWCKVTRKQIERDKLDTKPDWCPIKPLPEKMDCQSRHGLLQEQIMVGWNMCIDEILKGGD